MQAIVDPKLIFEFTKKVAWTPNFPMPINWEIKAIRVKPIPRSSHPIKSQRGVNSPQNNVWRTGRIAQQRIYVEHSIRRIKGWRILREDYRLESGAVPDDCRSRCRLGATGPNPRINDKENRIEGRDRLIFYSSDHLLWFAAQVLRACGVSDGIEDLANRVLNAAFEQLMAAAHPAGQKPLDGKLPWLQCHIRQSGTGPTQDAIQLVFDHLGLQRPVKLYRCERTGHLWYRSILGLCARIWL